MEWRAYKLLLAWVQVICKVSGQETVKKVNIPLYNSWTASEIFVVPMIGWCFPKGGPIPGRKAVLESSLGAKRPPALREPRGAQCVSGAG